MMKKIVVRMGEEGFTLLEVIVSLVVAFILGALFVQFMETNLTRSVTSIVWVQDANSVRRVMEDITAEHKRLMVETTTGDPLADLTGFVDSYSDPYTVDYSYISGFSGNGDEITGSVGDNILKVTVKKGEQKLVALFTK